MFTIKVQRYNKICGFANFGLKNACFYMAQVWSRYREKHCPIKIYRNVTVANSPNASCISFKSSISFSLRDFG